MKRVAAEIASAWRTATASRRFRAFAWGGLPAVVGVLLVLRRFLDFVEARPGVVLSDPLLALFAPHDVALVLFPIMYAAIVSVIVSLAWHPRELVAGLWAYALMIAVRMVVMYVTPLDPPPTMLALRDPFVELFGEHRTLTRDLFFSGHTATLFLFALTVPTRRLRMFAVGALVVVVVGVLLQHAHYTVDVIAAPFFSYGCHRVARTIVLGESRGSRAPCGDEAPSRSNE